ncbi:hypothetical protein ADK75_16390 [Streptomyces virginiae]|uniref:Uncharacterized protein n=1 Tax=Streptomyces virginiae TaxID=1961 RepID=A0A0L8MP10_STRVG|nr:hypothetical protein ADK75_16390 [Streptomyces virginiae]
MGARTAGHGAAVAVGRDTEGGGPGWLRRRWRRRGSRPWGRQRAGSWAGSWGSARRRCGTGPGAAARSAKGCAATG